MIYEFALARPCAAPYPHEHIHASMHRLRHALYRKGANWQLPEEEDMEFDEFDTLAARYLVGIDEAGCIRAQSRMIPCDRPYMLATMWPELAQMVPLPRTARDAEGSRTGVDVTLPKDEYRRWFAKLLIANVEWAVKEGIERLSFVTYQRVAEKSLEGAGLDVTYYGPTMSFPDGRFIAGVFPVSAQLAIDLRDLNHIEGDVFVPLPADRRAATKKPREVRHEVA
jgi:acyl homoserine lactone synthase